MAYAFARHERQERDLEGKIELSTGGTRPAEHVHEEVVTAMQAVGIDISGQTPHEITVEELQNSEYVVTMGCSAADVCPAGWAGDSRDWDLKDPDGRPPDEVAAIREEIERRVRALFEELEEAVR